MSELYVPYADTALGGGICGAKEPWGLRMCTRPAGHGGRHKASGMRLADGTEPVYAVWADPCMETP